MRHTILIITLILVAGLAVSCASTEGKQAAGPKHGETAAAQLDKAKTETKETAQAVKDYTYAQKTEFVAWMKKELAELQEQLDRLSAKVESSSGAAKADAKIKLDAVREKWTQVKKQLDQAEGATESTWDDVKAGIKKSYGDVKDSFDTTRQWLSDKIAP